MRTTRWSLVLVAPCLVGCATIFGQSTQVVSIRTEPPGAEVSVSNRSGVEVWRGSAPNLVPLKAGADYFVGETYTVSASKDGESATVVVDTTLHYGYLFGNAIFGGLIGWLIVDPASGAMWYLPNEVVINTDAYERGLVANESGLVSLKPRSVVPEVLPLDTASTPRLNDRVVNEWALPNGGLGKVVVVEPFPRNEANARTLGRRLAQETANAPHVLIYVFDDESAAKQWIARDAHATPEAAQSCESHYVGRYTRDGSSGTHSFSCILENSDGRVVSIRVD
jgi:hypothetical protein